MRNEKVPIGFTKYFDRIVCPHCDFGFVLIATFRTADDVLGEHDKWSVMQQCTCEYCPECGKSIK